MNFDNDKSGCVESDNGSHYLHAGPRSKALIYTIDPLQRYCLRPEEALLSPLNEPFVW